MKLPTFNSELKKEIIKNLSLLFICIVCSTTVSFFLIPNNLPAPAKPAKENVCPKIQKTFAKKSVFTGDEIIADIVEEVSPSVVHIITEMEQTLINDPRQFFFEDEFFKRFFGLEQKDFNFRKHPALKRKTAGSGSGVIITKDGYILTNYHVVQNASKIKVKTSEEKEFDAELVGKDKYSDLAVIKIKAKDLKPAKLSDSSKIRPGQWAIAVGSPHGLDNTVTLGIISAVRREVPELSNISFIQTDAAINPGNSGGPLVNIRGEVVGINTAIMGTAQNIGFAIPVNTAKTIVEQLKSGESIGHPWIGIAMSPLTEELSNALGVSKDIKGVVISRVMPNSPADKGGLLPGDIVQHIDGKKFEDPQKVQDVIKKKKIGDSISIQIYREGQMIGKTIKLGNWDDTENN